MKVDRGVNSLFLFIKKLIIAFLLILSRFKQQYAFGLSIEILYFRARAIIETFLQSVIPPEIQVRTKEILKYAIS